MPQNDHISQSSCETLGVVSLEEEDEEQHDHLLPHRQSHEWKLPSQLATLETTPINLESHLSKTKEAAAIAISSRHLERFPLIVVLVTGYAILATFAWTTTCILVYRPLTTQRYTIWSKSPHDLIRHYPSPRLYVLNERWFRAASIIQAIVTVVTIPLTSAICSAAAVVFVQRRARGVDLTLRRTVVLADRGWSSISIFVQLLQGHWKQYGSTFLYLAVVLNVLGGLISPLQSVFSTTVTV